MIDSENASIEVERVSGMATNKDVEHARTYDARTVEEIAGLLRNRPTFDGGDELTESDRYPVAGIVEGIRKDSHIVTSHPVGPKATTGSNEILPFPQEKIERLGKSIAAKMVSQNQSLFEDKGQESIEMKRSVSTHFSEKLFFAMGDISSGELKEMEFGIETWPSSIPLPEEQMHGVERRREFMGEVVKESIKVLMENDMFREVVAYENACFEFAFNTSYGACTDLTIWLDESDDKNKGIDKISITDDLCSF